MILWFWLVILARWQLCRAFQHNLLVDFDTIVRRQAHRRGQKTQLKCCESVDKDQMSASKKGGPKCSYALPDRRAPCESGEVRGQKDRALSGPFPASSSARAREHATVAYARAVRKVRRPDHPIDHHQVRCCLPFAGQNPLPRVYRRVSNIVPRGTAPNQLRHSSLRCGFVPRISSCFRHASARQALSGADRSSVPSADRRYQPRAQGKIFHHQERASVQHRPRGMWRRLRRARTLR